MFGNGARIGTALTPANLSVTLKGLKKALRKFSEVVVGTTFIYRTGQQTGTGMSRKDVILPLASAWFGSR